MLVVPDIGIIVVFALGILVGVLIGNKDFRYKFFVGLRKFLAQLSTGARAYSGQRGQQRETRKRQYPRQPSEEEITHRYVRTHQLIDCPKCRGTGRIAKKTPKLLEGTPFAGQTEVCPDCEGTGKIYD